MKSPFLAASLAANLALLAVFAFRPSLAPPALRDALQRYVPFASAPASTAQPEAPKPAAKPGRAKPPLWDQLATDDPRALIARLHAAGFPPDIIRSVISAQVGARYDPRIRDLQSPDPNLPFWRQSPSSLLNDPKRREAVTALQQERSRILRDLFKDPLLASADTAATANRPAWAAHLSTQQADLIQRIEQDYNEMMNGVRSSAGNIMLPGDRDQLALLEREKRADLASVLSPDQLADYELRTSPITRTIGNRFGNFEPTDAEYRAIYDTYQALSQKYPGGLPTLSSTDRQSMISQVGTQLQSALGEARYAEYVRETSNDYQLLTRLVKQEKLAPDAAIQIYNLRDSVEREANLIFDGPAQSVDSKRAALKELAQTARTQLQNTLGPVAGPAYESSSGNWLTNLENGTVVTTAKNPLILISTGTGTSSISGSSSSSVRGLPRTTPPSPPR